MLKGAIPGHVIGGDFASCYSGPRRTFALTFLALHSQNAMRMQYGIASREQYRKCAFT